MLIHVHELPQIVKLLNQLFSGHFNAKTMILDWGILIKRTVLIEDIGHGQVMSFPDLMIIKVMTRGDLKAASTKGHVYGFVGNDRDGSF